MKVLSLVLLLLVYINDTHGFFSAENGIIPVASQVLPTNEIPDRLYARSAFEVIDFQESLISITSFTSVSNGTYGIYIQSSINGALTSKVRKRPLLSLLICNDWQMADLTARASTFCTDGSFIKSNLCHSVYRMHPVVTNSAIFYTSDDAFFTQNPLEDDTTYHLVVANCEILGGETGILPSCLATDDLALNSINEEKCFNCDRMTSSDESHNSDECETSPRIFSLVNINGEVVTCESGDTGCLGPVNSTRPRMYGILAILWTVLGIAWVVMIYVNRSVVTCTLQTYMATAIIAKIMNFAILEIAWSTSYRTLLSNSEEFVMRIKLSLFSGLCESVCCLVLILMAKGFYISRNVITSEEAKISIGASVLWGLGWSIYQIFNPNAGAILCWWACCTGALYLILTGYICNNVLLSYQISLITGATIAKTDTNIYDKYVAFESFRSIVAAYFIASGAVYATDVMFLTIETYKFAIALRAIFELIFATAIGLTFRCKRVSYRYHVCYNHGPFEDIHFGAIVSVPGSNKVMPVPWEEGMDIPKMQANAFQHLTKEQVVVIHPDGAQQSIGNGKYNPRSSILMNKKTHFGTFKDLGTFKQKASSSDIDK